MTTHLYNLFHVKVRVLYQKSKVLISPLKPPKYRTKTLRFIAQWSVEFNPQPDVRFDAAGTWGASGV